MTSYFRVSHYPEMSRLRGHPEPGEGANSGSPGGVFPGHCRPHFRVVGDPEKQRDRLAATIGTARSSQPQRSPLSSDRRFPNRPGNRPSEQTMFCSPTSLEEKPYWSVLTGLIQTMATRLTTRDTNRPAALRADRGRGWAT